MRIFTAKKNIIDNVGMKEKKIQKSTKFEDGTQTCRK
jgi:hypothetical protein